jgi:hypothetical protein
MEQVGAHHPALAGGPGLASARFPQGLEVPIEDQHGHHPAAGAKGDQGQGEEEGNKGIEHRLPF